MLSLALQWAQQDHIPLPQALAAVTHRPARILGAGVDMPSGIGHMQTGGAADICIVNPNASWQVLGNEGEQMLSEALYIEKAFVEYFIKEVKSVPELHRTIQKIGGIASTMFEILGEYDLEKTPKEECEYWLRFFQNNNPMEKVTGARLRRLFAQTLDLFWETFATFYDVDIDATYDFDVPLQE